MRAASLQNFAFVLVLGALGCSSSEGSSDEGGSVPATGGVSTGGAATGGTVGSGGVATGGVVGSGGAVGTGGAVSTGGVVGSGGVVGTGGVATGGAVGTGGAATGGAGTGGGGPTTTCNEADGQVCNNQTGQHCGYTFEYWKDQGSGCLTNTADGFSVEWSNINNLLGRKGVRPGSASNVVTYEADYNPSGNSYLCVYGWTKGPLVEYYIVDSWGTWRPPGGEGHMGTVTSDGGTYDIYRTQRVNQPSIEGNTTFYQYWSVRTEKRESGTITVGNHFAKWEELGMDMGSMYEVSMTVEGYQSSGNADVKMSIE